MKQYYIKTNSNGVITYSLDLEKQKLPKIIAEKLTLIAIPDNLKIYNNYSTYKNGVFTENEDVYREEKALRELKRTATRELNQIRQWLADNDWKVNKIVIGEWSIEDPRWLAYIEERAVKRARQDEIIAKLGE